MTLSNDMPSPESAPAGPAPSLAALRVEIDRIDTALHGLLMERGDIIDRLIAVKARQGGGSAFRPGREAEMMRRLVTRHAGILPLDTVEGIWRIIISTFTYVQAPYSVHADGAAVDPAMRDSGRFHFGFTVPLRVAVLQSTALAAPVVTVGAGGTPVTTSPSSSTARPATAPAWTSSPSKARALWPKCAKVLSP